LSTYELSGQIRRTYKSASAVDFDLDIVNPLEGTISISLSGAASATMRSGRYVYDIYATDSAMNKTHKVLEGILEVVPGVTRGIHDDENQSND